jgi:hypothetical protein
MKVKEVINGFEIHAYVRFFREDRDYNGCNFNFRECEEGMEPVSIMYFNYRQRNIAERMERLLTEKGIVCDLEDEYSMTLYILPERKMKVKK